MRKIKSYARVVGKSFSPLCRSLLKDVLPKYELNLEMLPKLHNLHVEIGFGYGNLLYNAALKNPNQNFLGVEVYLNGVCNLLKLCEQQPLSNLHIHVGDADLLLNELLDNFVNTFYIFFPDPWPKKKHQKRRFINKSKIDLMTAKLKDKGTIKFITDVEDYSQQVESHINSQSMLVNLNTPKHNTIIMEEYVEKSDMVKTYDKLLNIQYIGSIMQYSNEHDSNLTKYYSKALKEERKIFPIVALKHLHEKLT